MKSHYTNFKTSVLNASYILRLHSYNILCLLGMVDVATRTACLLSKTLTRRLDERVTLKIAAPRCTLHQTDHGRICTAVPLDIDPSVPVR